MFPSGRQDRNSLSPIVHVSSLFASRDLSFLLCLPTRNSTTLVAWRIVAPLRIVRRTIYRVTCYRTRIINGVTASSNDIYIIEINYEMISVVDFCCIFNFERLKKKVEYSWRDEIESHDFSTRNIFLYF